MGQPHLIHLIISSHRTHAIEIVRRQWLLRNFYVFFSSVSLPWEVLPTVTTTVIVPLIRNVVPIMFADGNVLPVRMTTNVDRTNNVVIAYVSVVSLLVPVRTKTNVDGARNAVIKNALVVRLLVPVHTTTNVTKASSAVIANASVNRLLVPARTTTNVTLERIVVREFVPHTVVGAVELLQALLSARLSSWPSSFPSYPAAAVLVVRTTAIVHPVLWSSPANRNNKWSQPT